MKKVCVCICLCAALSTVPPSFAQSAVRKTGAPVQTAGKTALPADSDALPAASIEDWKRLSQLNGDEYVELFTSYLAAAAASDAQPYALAECLWYACFVQPSLSPDEAASELRRTLETAVSDFIFAVGSGTVSAHVQSDSAYAFFSWLAAARPRPAAAAPVPAMPVFDAAGGFAKPSAEARKVALYRAQVKLERLCEAVSARYDDIETAVLEPAEVSAVFSEGALRYVLRRSESAAPVYRALLRSEAAVSEAGEPLAAEIAVAEPEALFERFRALGVAYGFAPASVLPPYSAGIAELTAQDEFAPYYIPARDASLFVSDLAWLSDAVPLYLNRFTALLYRPAGTEEN